MSEGDAGASPGNSRAMVAMFAAGKWWPFSPRHQPIKAQRSASHLGTAAGMELCSSRDGAAGDRVVSGTCDPVRESEGHVPPPEQAFWEAAMSPHTVCHK